MNELEAIAFVKEHGVVTESARGPVPNLAEGVAGAPIRGNWWGHPRGQKIFRITRAVRAHRDILVCRLVHGKVTYVHRRLWPHLVVLAKELGTVHLAAIREVHTAQGKHVLEETPFPQWVPAEVKAKAKKLQKSRARAALPL